MKIENSGPGVKRSMKRSMRKLFAVMEMFHIMTAEMVR